MWNQRDRRELPEVLGRIGVATIVVDQVWHQADVAVTDWADTTRPG